MLQCFDASCSRCFDASCFVGSGRRRCTEAGSTDSEPIEPVVTRLPNSHGTSGYGCRAFVTRDDSLSVRNAKKNARPITARDFTGPGPGVGSRGQAGGAATSRFGIVRRNKQSGRFDQRRAYHWRKRWRKEVFSKGSMLKRMARKAPEERPVPRNGTPLGTSPVGVFCSMKTSRLEQVVPLELIRERDSVLC
jgi:hypothetical protein